MTEKEIAQVLRDRLAELKERGYKWIGRDEDGCVWAFNVPITKSKWEWVPVGDINSGDALPIYLTNDGAEQDGDEGKDAGAICTFDRIHWLTAEEAKTLMPGIKWENDEATELEPLADVMERYFGAECVPYQKPEIIDKVTVESMDGEPRYELPQLAVDLVKHWIGKGFRYITRDDRAPRDETYKLTIWQEMPSRSGREYETENRLDYFWKNTHCVWESLPPSLDFFPFVTWKDGIFDLKYIFRRAKIIENTRRRPARSRLLVNNDGWGVEVTEAPEEIEEPEKIEGAEV